MTELENGGETPGPRDAQLAFLDRASSAVAGRAADGANIAVARRAANLRGIDGDFLLELAEPFAPEWEPPGDNAEDVMSPGSFAGGGQPSSQAFTTTEPSLPTVNSAANLHAGPREHFGRVLIVGLTGSGKTTFKHCVSQVLRFQAPVVQPSAFASSSTFHFSTSATSHRPAEKLYIDLVDTGPLQRAGLGRLYRSADLVVLTWSLAAVKQTKKRAGLLSTVESAVFHPREIQELQSVIRDLSVNAPGTPMVVVGTHKDVLSERSVASVEKVVQTLERHVADAIDLAARCERPATVPSSAGTSQHNSPGPSPSGTPTKQHQESPPRTAAATTFVLPPLVLLGTYATSSDDGKCIGTIGGPVTIGTMWRQVCESVLKTVRSRNVLPMLQPSTKMGFFQTISEHNDLVARVARFFTCLRAEHGIILLGVHQLAQAFFAFGAPSKAVVDAVLQSLQHRGDIVVLNRTTEHPRQVLLLPYLPSRIVSAVLSVASGAKAAVEERVARSKLVSIDDCVNADPTREFNRGVFKRGVIRHLAACVPSDVAQDRTLIFVRVARQVGFMFRLNESGVPANAGLASSVVARNLYGSIAGPSSSSDQTENASASGANHNVSFFSHDSASPISEKFVVPALVASVTAPTTLGALRREMDARRIHSCVRHVAIPLVPSGFISLLQCELGEYVVQRTHVTRSSLWLSRDHMRCFVFTNRDPASLPDDITIDLLFFGATGPGSLRSFALFVAAVMKDVSHALKAAHVHHISTVSVASSATLVASTNGSPHRVSASILGMQSGSPNAASATASFVEEQPLMTISEAERDDSVTSILRLDLCVAPLSG